MEDFISCKGILKLLQQFFDNELDENGTNSVKNHISICQNCEKEFNRLKKLSDSIKHSLKDITIPEIIDETEIVGILYLNLSCDEVISHLSEYIDEEVDFKLHFLIEKHLNSCDECKSKYQDLLKVNELVKVTLNDINDVDFSLFDNVCVDIDKVFDCYKSTENLNAYIDRELPKEELISISKHILSCKHCRRDFELLKNSRKKLNRYFNNYENSSDIDICEKKIVAKAQKYQIRFIFTAATTAMLVLAGLTWFSIHAIEPNLEKNVYEKHPDVNEVDPAYYVNAEQYMLMSANKDAVSEASEVISVGFKGK